jgi:hypothetical protein
VAVWTRKLRSPVLVVAMVLVVAVTVPAAVALWEVTVRIPQGLIILISSRSWPLLVSPLFLCFCNSGCTYPACRTWMVDV